MVRETCNCGKPTQMITSWTNRNPGRRFCRCPNYKEAEGCRYWDWVDPEMCQRAKEIIPGLLRSMSNMENEITKLQDLSRMQQAKARRLKFWLILQWIVIVYMFLFKSRVAGNQNVE